MKLAYFLWAALERFGANGISLVGNVALSYFVAKEDFGIVTSLMIFTQLIFVFNDCGLSDGVMRRQNATDRDFNTLFWFNVIAGSTLCLAFNLFAPLIGSMFSTPEETEAVVRVVGIGAVFGAMNIMPMTKLRYNLKFKKISIISIITVLTSVSTAITLGYLGMRYWAVVTLSVGYQFFMFVYLVITTKWHLKIEFDRKVFGELWRFGVNLMMSVITIQVAQNIFSLLIGRRSQVQAGLYGQANKLQFSPQKSIEGIMSSTYYTVVAKETDEERKRVEVAKMIDTTVFVLLLFIGCAFAISFPLIDVVFPASGIDIGPYFRILLVLGFFQAFNRFAQVLYKLYNKTALVRNLSFVENGAVIAMAVALFALKVEVMPVIAVAIVITAAMTLVYLLYGAKVSGVKFSTFGGAFLRNMLSISAATAVAFLVAGLLPSAVGLFVGIVVFFVALLGFCAIFNRRYVGFFKKAVAKILPKNKEQI